MFRYLYGAIIKSFNASVFIQYCICSMKTETAMFQPESPGPGAVQCPRSDGYFPGRGEVRQCGAGLGWNTATRQCDWAANVRCRYRLLL